MKSDLDTSVFCTNDWIFSSTNLRLVDSSFSSSWFRKAGTTILNCEDDMTPFPYVSMVSKTTSALSAMLEESNIEDLSESHCFKYWGVQIDSPLNRFPKGHSRSTFHFFYK
eukprot:m.39856 g.39856  ORF g.39856 m.39856 type:complete len:111 (-) comp9598_c0_seq1:1829-2161(-)